MGAFAPGVPVQPVLLGFRRNTRFNPGWGLDASTYWHFLRMMTQFKTHIDITVMPVRLYQLCLASFRSCHNLKFAFLYVSSHVA